MVDSRGRHRESTALRPLAIEVGIGRGGSAGRDALSGHAWPYWADSLGGGKNSDFCSIERRERLAPTISPTATGLLGEIRRRKPCRHSFGEGPQGLRWAWAQGLLYRNSLVRENWCSRVLPWSRGTRHCRPPFRPKRLSIVLPAVRPRARQGRVCCPGGPTSHWTKPTRSASPASIHVRRSTGDITGSTFARDVARQEVRHHSPYADHQAARPQTSGWVSQKTSASGATDRNSPGRHTGEPGPAPARPDGGGPLTAAMVGLGSRA